MSKLSFRARALDASKPMPIYLAEELPDLPDYSAINRAVPQMPSGMEKEEESEHHLQRAISGTGLIIPTPEVSQVCDIDFYERCYPPDYKMPKQHIHMQPLWEEQEAPEYDIDSEDERWLKQQRHPELTELKFEQMMDKLEKCSGQTVVTLHEAKLLLERQDDLVIAVYDYWLNKRLTTQHPLILSVRTENRPGQSANNPYLAFRRRTEKMQTRKNRKNDESSYEKMLKLRRDLARALSLLELVARRERAKRELVKLTALLTDRRYVAGDFANQLLPDPPPRPAFTTVPINPPFRREQYPAPLYPPRAAPPPVDTPRQREKRPYKRRKHRHAPVGTAHAHRDSGVYTSSEEESPRVEPASPPDDGPFAFRRKPGCFYEMPTSTLCGDPVDPDTPSKDGLFQHELDPRHRYTLTSIRSPYPHCVGFARRRVGRGGRVLLDRVQTPLDDLWPHLPFHTPEDKDKQQLEIENNRYRTPKEITTDYHTSGKYPWRHAFRRHLSRHPDLWTDVKPDVTHVKQDDFKLPDDFFKLDKVEPMDLPDIVQDSERCKPQVEDVVCKSEHGKSDTSVRTIDRKRSWSDCSDSSYDSDESLHPVEKEFEQFIDEVNQKWLHFRPRTATPSPPPPPRDEFLLSQDTPIAVEILNEPFTTAEFTLSQLYPQLGDTSVDADEDLLNDNFTGLTEDQMESILSETDLKSLADDRKLSLSVAMLDALDDRVKPADTKRKRESFGSSSVVVSAGDVTPVYCCAAPVPTPTPTPAPPPPATPPRPRPRNKHNTTKKVVVPRAVVAEPGPLPAAPPPPAPVPAADIIVEEVNDLPSVRLDNKRRKEDTIEEVQLAHGVQLKTVQTRHSPLKKHIITSSARVRSEPVAVSSAPHPHIVTQPVSDALKVRLQNHLLSGQGSVLVQNGPYTGPVVAVPVQSRDGGLPTAGVSVASTSSARRLQLSGAMTRPGAVVASVPAMGTPVLLHSHAPSKLKVLHAHTLTHSQRTQILAQTQNRNISQVPAVVSLATISDPKSAMLYKAAQGSVAQLFEIKSGQLGKGPHLVNVVRQPQQGKPTLARLDYTDKKRPLVFDATLKGNIACATRPHRVAVLDRSTLEGRIVRAPLPPHVRHQLQFKNRPLAGPSAPPAKTASIPSAVVANLLQKTHQLPKGGQKIAISGPGGQALSANVQAIAISTAQLKARQARLVAPPRPPPVAEIVETSSATTSQQAHQETSLQPTDETETNGTVRRRAADTLPMEVT